MIPSLAPRRERLLLSRTRKMFCSSSASEPFAQGNRLSDDPVETVSSVCTSSIIRKYVLRSKKPRRQAAPPK
jgi:hypothetical protein